MHGRPLRLLWLPLLAIACGPPADPGGAPESGEEPIEVLVRNAPPPGSPDAGVAASADSGRLAPVSSPDGGLLAEGIWISRAEVLALPISGTAWSQLKAQADAPAGAPDLSNQDQMNNVYVLAKALVFARTGDQKYRTEVRSQCTQAIDTELGGRTLALGRELAAYVIAADLVGLDPSVEEPRFRSWLRRTLTENLDGRTLISTHEDRPNNWGTHAGASRAAVAAYLMRSADPQDQALGQQQMNRAAAVFKGYLGDRSSYAGFSYGELSWQADPLEPVGVNPQGATKNGYSIEGAFPDDMRRGCAFTWPPCHTGYAWGAFEGASVQAEILHRAGHDAWAWEDQALLRAARYLLNLHQKFGGWWAEGDDEWNPWLINHAYGTSFPTANPARPGKNMGWTNWTHDRSTRPRR